VTAPSRALVTSAGRRDIVAIDGLDGSGKSEFARALAAACEAEGAGPVVVLRVDDFRRPLPAVSPGADESALYYDEYYDFTSLDACLAAFLAGASSATIARFDQTSERIEGTHRLDFGDARLAVLEGVFVLRATNVTRATLVVLEVTEAEARRRVLARDLARGRAREIVEHRMNNRYFPAQRRYRAVFDPAARAAVVVDNESFIHPRLLRCETERMPPLVARAIARVVRS
jgi:uridine kinase